MAITAALIKDLRARTGAGMLDCRNALTEEDGDLTRAIALLRKRGAAAAEKKSGRIAAQGIIVQASNAEAKVLVEINCETDFVAKDATFQQFAGAVAETILQTTPADVAQLAKSSLGDGDLVATAHQNIIAKIGENINIRRFARLANEDALVSSYLHGARIGVLVKVRNGGEALGRDLAMHIAASRPLGISEADLDPDLLTNEREIYTAQAAESNKPAAIAEKMVDGRVAKFIKENTLLGQNYVKDPKSSVGALLTASDATVVEMVRFEVGEGLEKRTDDFFSEVMAQANG